MGLKAHVDFVFVENSLQSLSFSLDIRLHNAPI